MSAPVFFFSAKPKHLEKQNNGKAENAARSKPEEEAVGRRKKEQSRRSERSSRKEGVAGSKTPTLEKCSQLAALDDVSAAAAADDVLTPSPCRSSSC